jgi:hypothetical protein
MADNKKLVFNPSNAVMVYQAAPVEAGTFNPANAVTIDPQTGAQFDPQIPTQMALQQNAEAQRAYNQANPQSMTSKMLEGVGKLYDESKLAGLAPEVSPLMGAFNTSAAATMAGSAPARAITSGAGKIANVASTVASAPFKAAGQIVSETASDFVKKAYQIGKGGDKNLASAWRQGKAAGLSADEKGMSAIGNYFRAFFPESNVSDIAKAKDMSKQAGGVWDVAKKAQEAEAKIAQISPRSNWSLPKDATLVLPENLQVSPQNLGFTQAFKAGQEATWLPSGKTFVDVLKNPRTFPSLVSPRLEANLGYGVGVGSRYANKAGQLYNQLPNLTEADVYNLSLLAPRLYEGN